MVWPARHPAEWEGPCLSREARAATDCDAVVCQYIATMFVALVPVAFTRVTQPGMI